MLTPVELCICLLWLFYYFGPEVLTLLPLYAPHPWSFAYFYHQDGTFLCSLVHVDPFDCIIWSITHIPLYSFSMSSLWNFVFEFAYFHLFAHAHGVFLLLLYGKMSIFG